MFKYREEKAALTLSLFIFNANCKAVSSHCNLSEVFFLMSSHIIRSKKFFKVVCRFVPGLKKYSVRFFRFAFSFQVHTLKTEFNDIVVWVEFHFLIISSLCWSPILFPPSSNTRHLH